MAEHTKFTRIDLGFNDIGQAEGAIELHMEIDGEPCGITLSYEARKQDLYQSLQVAVPTPKREPKIAGPTLAVRYICFTPTQREKAEAIGYKGEE